MAAVNLLRAPHSVGRSTGRPGPAGYLSLCFIAALYLSGVRGVSTALLVLVAGIAVAVVGTRAHLHKTALPVIVYVAVVLAMGVGVQAMPTSFGELSAWLNNDGRFLIALLPVIVIAACDVRIADLELFVRGLTVAVWLNVPVLVATVATGQPYHGLTSTHHAIGMATGASLVVFVMARRSQELRYRPSIAVMTVAAVMCAVSGSRTALVGLFAVLAWTAWRRRSVANLVRVAVVTGVLLAVAAALSDRVASSLALGFDPAFRELAANVFLLGTDQSEVSQYYATVNAHGQGGAEVGNILARLYYWGVALGMWLKSPIVGIGSFRFNDGSLSYSGWDGVVSFATTGVRDSTGVIGAHNQYIGALVENGVLGLALLLAIWIVPYRSLAVSEHAPPGARSSAMAMVPFALATALTGYTLTSPALTFVCLTWLAMVASLGDDGTEGDSSGAATAVTP